MLCQCLVLECVPLALPVFAQLKWGKINTGKARGTPNFSVNKALDFRIKQPFQFKSLPLF
jgi:hypothetical protein